MSLMSKWSQLTSQHSLCPKLENGKKKHKKQYSLDFIDPRAREWGREEKRKQERGQEGWGGGEKLHFLMMSRRDFGFGKQEQKSLVSSKGNEMAGKKEKKKLNTHKDRNWGSFGPRIWGCAFTQHWSFPPSSSCITLLLCLACKRQKKKKKRNQVIWD